MTVNWKPFLTDFLWTWLGRFANPTKLDECRSGCGDIRGRNGVAHAWSFLRTAAERPGVPGVVGLSPYSDMAAAAVAAVEGEGVGKQAVATRGRV